ncbi:hypothetical protein A6770_37445 [Nostoc minutum NIES-26]|uniref:Uncharacterized protein n=1 Tax=Nostoc minutum NIES-26 TaxID=1844469 RepID=A0A367RY60_9NOSO|nr:hypothetical protein A6770_37445 [Nostoc minutum NIES-26]
MLIREKLCQDSETELRKISLVCYKAVFIRISETNTVQLLAQYWLIPKKCDRMWMQPQKPKFMNLAYRIKYPNKTIKSAVATVFCKKIPSLYKKCARPYGSL